MSMFGLVDCNSFYVSCERVFQPRLNGQAVGVLSHNNGCLIARSNEIRALGIEMNGAHKPHQRIMTNRSFGKLTESLGEIHEASVSTASVAPRICTAWHLRCNHLNPALFDTLGLAEIGIDTAWAGWLLYWKRRFESQLAGALKMQLKRCQRPALAFAERVFCCPAFGPPPI